MLDDSKYRSPYYGLWLALLIMVVIPFVFYGIFYGLFAKYQHESRAVNEACARACGFGVGAVFDLSLFVAGAFAPHFAAVLKRIFGFFGNLKVSVGFAIKCYFEDIKSDGAVFLIVLSVTALTAYAAYTGVRDFISLWIS